MVIYDYSHNTARSDRLSSGFPLWRTHSCVPRRDSSRRLPREVSQSRAARHRIVKKHNHSICLASEKLSGMGPHPAIPACRHMEFGR